VLRTVLKFLGVIVSASLICLVAALLAGALVSPEEGNLARSLVAAGMGLFLGALATACLAGYTLRDLYGLGGRGASAQLLRNLLGLSGSIQIIDGGHTVVPTNYKGSLFGPRLVIIRASAVLFYQGPKQTRIEGPGFVRTRLFEYAQRAHNLRPLQRTFSFSDLLTKDDLPLRAEVRVEFGAQVSPEVIRGAKKLTPADVASIQKLDLHCPDADRELAVRSVVETELRRLVRPLTADVANQPGNLTAMDQTLWSQCNRRLSLWGLYAYSVAVTKLCPSEELLRAYTWAEASASMDIKTAVAAQAQNAVGGQLTRDNIAIETLRRVLLAFAGDPKLAKWSTPAGASTTIEGGRPLPPLPPGE